MGEAAGFGLGRVCPQIQVFCHPCHPCAVVPRIMLTAASLAPTWARPHPQLALQGRPSPIICAPRNTAQWDLLTQGGVKYDHKPITVPFS